MLYNKMHYSGSMIYNCYHKGDKIQFCQLTLHYIYKPMNKYMHRLAASELYQVIDLQYAKISCNVTLLTLHMFLH